MATDASAATTVGADAQGAAAPEEKPKPRFDIYGFAMLDMGFDTGQVNPDWYDVLRPTKLPTFKDEYGKDGNFYAGVRQSRVGFKAWVPTDVGELKTIFEFELFGTGVDAGQTAFRLRHAWGELGWMDAGFVASLASTFGTDISKLEPGDMSRVVRGKFGYWVFQVAAKRPAGPVPFADLQDVLLRKMREKKVNEAAAAIVKERRAKATIEALDPAVKAAL